MALLVVFRTHQGYYFSYDRRQNGFSAVRDIEEAKKVLNWDGYHAAHHTWSTSAAMYWMNFKPCVVQIDFENITNYVKELVGHSLNSICGHEVGIPIKDEFKSFIDENIVFDPKLITENFSKDTKPFYES